MFALLALISFILALFNVILGNINLVILGFVFVSLHLLFGTWPLGAITLVRRRD